MVDHATEAIQFSDEVIIVFNYGLLIIEKLIIVIYYNLCIDMQFKSINIKVVDGISKNDSIKRLVGEKQH